ncbi:MAG: hypothetical protein AAFZ92_10990 [Pseudomonadota bacterium]
MKNRYIHPLDEPLRHPDHKRPVTRRDFVAQGFTFGTGAALGGSLYSLVGSNNAHALSTPLQDFLNNTCGSFNNSNAKIPFICFDLAGGANFAGSSVLVGGEGGQEDFISTSGYQKQGLPVDQTPNLDSDANPLINDSFGLKFHSDSPYLRGLLEFAPNAAANTNGAVIPARSENDTGNNPHNPMYAINRVGADGELLALIGSRASDSGGNSVAPVSYINPEVRPTKVDRASDVTGLVDTGDLVGLLNTVDTTAVMESIYRLSNAKLDRVDTGLTGAPTTDAVVKDLVRCGYLNSASIAERFGDPNALNPDTDPDIVGSSGVFTADEYNNDREFRKTAAIMKLVVNGNAGAGTVTMGGYDYHGGRRARGEGRDLRAGRCIGATLEYARRLNKPIMIYVFSDGSLSSDGVIDNQPGDGLMGRASTDPGGRGKGEWVSDNQQTACSWFLVYNPNGRPQLLGTTPEEQARHQQIGYFRASGDVETTATPIANNVSLLVDAVALNYMALHGEQGNFASLFGNQLGNASMLDSLTAFQPIVNGTINNPV